MFNGLNISPFSGLLLGFALVVVVSTVSETYSDGPQVNLCSYSCMYVKVIEYLFAELGELFLQLVSFPCPGVFHIM